MRLLPIRLLNIFLNIRKAPTDKQRQSWAIFLKNHSKGIWAMDFFVVPTLCFQLLYVFLIVNHDRRKIIHFAVTANPSSAWVIQQIREATPYGETPDYLIHDNDSIFTARSLRHFLENTSIKDKRQASVPPGKTVFVKGRSVFCGKNCSIMSYLLMRSI